MRGKKHKTSPDDPSEARRVLRLLDIVHYGPGARCRAQPAVPREQRRGPRGRARPSRRKQRLPGSGGAGPGPRLPAGPAQPGLAGSASPRPPSVSPLGAAAQGPALPGAARLGSGAAQAGDGGSRAGKRRARGRGRPRVPSTAGLRCWQRPRAPEKGARSVPPCCPAPAVPAVAQRCPLSARVDLRAGVALPCQPGRRSWGCHTSSGLSTGLVRASRRNRTR
ncbi:proapoptotic nucleolar protein 1 [Zonotrichia leucophrys gambelii]|uniref:proapoptotic nucleolar protein 1 n=1 Tax=Zonotrichia leucophrys gambelii TaxID=257770 RepID=UPI003140B3EB